MTDYSDGQQVRVQPDFRKGPTETLDFPFNWKPQLNGDTIFTSQFALPDGMTLVSSSNTSTTATPFVSGGDLGTIYRIVNNIVTVGGRAMTRTRYVLVTDQ